MYFLIEDSAGMFLIIMYLVVRSHLLVCSLVT